MEEEDLNLVFLNKIVKLCKMGMTSIEFVVEKMKKGTLKDILNNQHSRYQVFLEDALNLFKKYNIEPEEFKIEEKMLIWPGVRFNNLTSTNDDYISDLILQGYYVAASDIHKKMRLNMNLKPEVKELLDNFLTFIDVNIKELRVFL